MPDGRMQSRTCPFCHAEIDAPCWDEDSVFGKRVRKTPHCERQFGLTSDEIQRGKARRAEAGAL